MADQHYINPSSASEFVLYNQWISKLRDILQSLLNALREADAASMPAAMSRIHHFIQTGLQDALARLLGELHQAIHNPLTTRVLGINPSITLNLDTITSGAHFLHEMNEITWSTLRVVGSLLEGIDVHPDMEKVIGPHVTKIVQIGYNLSSHTRTSLMRELVSRYIQLVQHRIQLGGIVQDSFYHLLVDYLVKRQYTISTNIESRKSVGVLISHLVGSVFG